MNGGKEEKTDGGKCGSPPFPPPSTRTAHLVDRSLPLVGVPAPYLPDLHLLLHLLLLLEPYSVRGLGGGGGGGRDQLWHGHRNEEGGGYSQTRRQEGG